MRYADLIKYFGSQAEAARKLELSQPSVWGWQKNGIPLDRQIEIEVKTEGALRAALPKSVRGQSA